MKNIIKKGAYAIAFPLAFAAYGNAQNFDKESLDSLFNSSEKINAIGKAYSNIIQDNKDNQKIQNKAPISKNGYLILKICPKNRVDEGDFAIGYDFFNKKTGEANFYIYDSKQVDYQYPKIKVSTSASEGNIEQLNPSNQVPTRLVFGNQYEPTTIIYELSIERMYGYNDTKPAKNCVDLKVQRTEDGMPHYGDFLPRH
ncbi:MAG: hypothetical protein KKE23_04070 [Nanoarchaeota archaeon]|nr:hypothetical protein [Nanoarchaeota archaeon]